MCTTPHHTYIATQYNMCCVYIKCILNGFLFIFAHHSLCAYVSLFRIRRTAGNKKKKSAKQIRFCVTIGSDIGCRKTMANTYLNKNNTYFMVVVVVSLASVAACLYNFCICSMHCIVVVGECDRPMCVCAIILPFIFPFHSTISIQQKIIILKC